MRDCGEQPLSLNNFSQETYYAYTVSGSIHIQEKLQFIIDINHYGDPQVCVLHLTDDWCFPLPNVTNGYWESNECMFSMVSNNTICGVTCSVGYAMDGDATTICQNGRWTHGSTFTCKSKIIMLIKI